MAITARNVEQLLEAITTHSKQVSRVAFAIEAHVAWSRSMKLSEACVSCGCLLVPFGALSCPACRNPVGIK